MNGNGRTAALRGNQRTATVAAILIPLILLAAASWYAYRAAFRELHRRTEETTVLLVEHTNRLFESAEQAMWRVADRLRSAPVADPSADPGLREHLETIVRQVEAVTSIWVFSLDGRHAAGSDLVPSWPAGPQDREFFAVPAAADPGRVFVSAPFIARPTGRAQFAMSMKVAGSGGASDAIVVANLSPGAQAAFLDRILPDVDRVIGLTRGDGHVLARSPDLGDALVRLEPRTGLMRAIASPEGRDAGTFTAVAQLGAVERHYAYRRLEDVPVYLSVGLATGEAWAAWRRSVAVLGVVAAIGSLLLVLVLRRLGEAAAAEARAASDLIAAQSRLFQAQKLEALGKLTSGVAHDFNNLLMAISASLAPLRAQVAPPGRRHVETIGLAVDRGERLAKQLLGFTRKGSATRTAIDLNARLAETRPLIEKLVGADVVIGFETSPGPLPAVADAEGFELSLLNLVANARDAMPDGGTMRIVTGRRADSAVVCVSDTGTGMSEEVRARCLEPFFTTKDIGHGTGLGLSAVYGFVQRAGGTLEIDSAPGLGTTVRLLLPIATEAGEMRQAAAPGSGPTTTVAPGPLRVLVVEDDPLVAMAMVDFLQDAGLTVETATTANEALARLGSSADAFDVVLTDVGLPGGRSGVELARDVRRTHPAIRLVVVTGYGAGSRELGALPPNAEILHKPFAMRDLIDVVTSSSGEGARTPTA